MNTSEPTGYVTTSEYFRLRDDDTDSDSDTETDSESDSGIVTYKYRYVKRVFETQNIIKKF